MTRIGLDKMKSIHQQIVQTIRDFKQGTIFFPEQFDQVGNNDAVRQTLSRICKEGLIIRLSQGVYLYPVVDKELGVLYPSVDTIAKAIALRDKARIIPTGIYALNRLGLSTQVPMKVVYLTDGIPRKINIAEQTITFKQTAPKNFAYKGEITPLVVSALKEIGKDRVSNEETMQIQKMLKHEPKDVVLSDAQIAPRWITNVIMSIIKDSENE